MLILSIACSSIYCFIYSHLLTQVFGWLQFHEWTILIGIFIVSPVPRFLFSSVMFITDELLLLIFFSHEKFRGSSWFFLCYIPYSNVHNKLSAFPKKCNLKVLFKTSHCECFASCKTFFAMLWVWDPKRYLVTPSLGAQLCPVHLQSLTCTWLLMLSGCCSLGTPTVLLSLSCNPAFSFSRAWASPQQNLLKYWILQRHLSLMALGSLSLLWCHGPSHTLARPVTAVKRKIQTPLRQKLNGCCLPQDQNYRAVCSTCGMRAGNRIK